MSSYEYLAFYKIGGATTLRLSVIQPHQMLATGIFVQTLPGRILTVKNVVPGDTIDFFKIRVQEMEGEAFTHPCLKKGLGFPRAPPIPLLLQSVPPSAIRSRLDSHLLTRSP